MKIKDNIWDDIDRNSLVNGRDGKFVFKEFSDIPFLGKLIALHESGATSISEDKMKELEKELAADVHELKFEKTSLSKLEAAEGLFEMLIACMLLPATILSVYPDKRIIVKISEGTPYNPISAEPELFIKFASLSLDDESILNFINRYGNLGTFKWGKFFNKGWWCEPLGWFKQEQEKFRKLYEDFKQASGDDSNEECNQRLTIGLVQGLKGAFAFLPPDQRADKRHKPEKIKDCIARRGWYFNSLYHAIYLQLYDAIRRDLHIMNCRNCHLDFIGRQDSLWCSDACRKRYERELIKQ